MSRILRSSYVTGSIVGNRGGNGARIRISVPGVGIGRNIVENGGRNLCPDPDTGFHGKFIGAGRFLPYEFDLGSVAFLDHKNGDIVIKLQLFCSLFIILISFIGTLILVLIFVTVTSKNFETTHVVTAATSQKIQRSGKS
jgi:hypothetical protein